MIKVDILKQSNYPVNATRLKKKLADFFVKKGIVSNAQVSVAIIGEKQILDISKKYLKDNVAHNVLSFTPDEAKGRFIYPPDGTLYLGEILVCYPLVFEEAKTENKLIEDKVYELIEHGAKHLLGEHHR